MHGPNWLYKLFKILTYLLLIIPGALFFRQNDYNLTFTRLELVRFNKHYVSDIKVVTFKYNRTCAVANLTIDFKYDFGYNLMLQAQAFKFASNEYRLFPIRYMFSYCDAVAKNDYGFGDLYKCGNFTKCPMKKGRYTFCYWTTNSRNFPPFVPNGEYMVEGSFIYRSIELAVFNIYGSVTRAILVGE